MSPNPLKKWLVFPMLAAAGVWFGWAILLGRADVTDPATWQALASPGLLSSGHAFLATDCTACHTANKGVEAQNCIACHANDQYLLQRQPTAFHADVRSCAECHVEHQGTDRRPTQMDHATLIRLGLGHAIARREEASLNCAACHSNEDRHRSLFGTDCIQCHTTTAWTVPEFRHPAPTSTSCAQCHQAPPSHYMEHFRMISMTVAHQPFAKVNQCFLCHQTNDWNDIKGVGWYKHH